VYGHLVPVVRRIKKKAKKMKAKSENKNGASLPTAHQAAICDLNRALSVQERIEADDYWKKLLNGDYEAITLELANQYFTKAGKLRAKVNTRFIGYLLTLRNCGVEAGDEYLARQEVSA
jgi:hypothetical protein